MNLPNKFYQYPIRCDKKIPNVYTTACKRYGDPRKPTQWMLGHGVPNIYTIVCPSVCLSVNFYIFDFFSRTTGPILTKLGTKHS